MFKAFDRAARTASSVLSFFFTNHPDRPGSPAVQSKRTPVMPVLDSSLLAGVDTTNLQTQSQSFVSIKDYDAFLRLLWSGLVIVDLKGVKHTFQPEGGGIVRHKKEPKEADSEEKIYYCERTDYLVEFLTWYESLSEALTFDEISLDYKNSEIYEKHEKNRSKEVKRVEEERDSLLQISEEKRTPEQIAKLKTLEERKQILDQQNLENSLLWCILQLLRNNKVSKTTIFQIFGYFHSKGETARGFSALQNCVSQSHENELPLCTAEQDFPRLIIYQDEKETIRVEGEVLEKATIRTGMNMRLGEDQQPRVIFGREAPTSVKTSVSFGANETPIKSSVTMVSDSEELASGVGMPGTPMAGGQSLTTVAPPTVGETPAPLDGKPSLQVAGITPSIVRTLKL